MPMSEREGRQPAPQQADRGAPVTLKTLAERAGVSVAVVSAVINDSPYVRMSAATRDRVRAEIERAGYIPNQAARSLRMRRTTTIAVVLPVLHNPIFRPALDGIYAEAGRQGYAIMLGEAHHLAAGSRLMERVVAHGGVDGLLLRTTSSLPERTIERLLAARTPMVTLEPHVDGSVASVAIDEAAGIALVTQHLLEHGHRQVGFFGGDPGYRGTLLRTAAYRDTMRAGGLQVVDDDIWWGPQEPTLAYGPARAFLDRQRHLTAIVCNNVTTAFGVAAAAHDLGIPVPGQLSLAAFHDVPDADVARPAITAVRMPMRELGEHGVRQLLSAIAGEPLVDVIVPVAPVLISRGSVAPPAGEAAPGRRPG